MLTMFFFKIHLSQKMNNLEQLSVICHVYQNHIPIQSNIQSIQLLSFLKRIKQTLAYYKLNLILIISSVFKDKYNKFTKKMANNYDYLFKFIIIGDSSVGKSCLLLRFTQNRFKSDHQPTLGVQFGSKNATINDLTIKIQIWDTAGQQSFKSITRSYYKGSIAAFLVYDVTNRQSFENLNKWLYEVKNHSHEKVQIVIVGNKIDIKDKRQVSAQQAQKFAQLNGYSYFQTSAQSGEKVDELFKSVGKKIVQKISSQQINPQAQTSYGLRKGKKATKKDSNSPSISKNSSTIKVNNEQLNQQKSRCCGK